MMRLSQVNLWEVYRVTANEIDPPKEKFAIIAHLTSEKAAAFLINSSVTEWLKGRPELWFCYPSVLAKEHSFLTHDSFVNCERVFEFFEWEIVRKSGVISVKAKADILDAVHDCPSLERKHKKLILSREGYPGY